MKTDTTLNEKPFFQPFITANQNRIEDIAPAEILQSDSFKDLTETQAAELAKVIKEFTCIVFEVANLQSQPQAPVIEMNSHLSKSKAA